MLFIIGLSLYCKKVFFIQIIASDDFLTDAGSNDLIPGMNWLWTL